MSRVKLPQSDLFSVSRKVVCILPNTKNRTGVPSLEETTIHRSERRVNELLTDSLKQLSNISDHRLPRVHATIQPIYRPKGTLKAVFDEELLGALNDVRAGVFLVDLQHPDTEAGLDALSISHFVEVVRVNDREDQGWFPAADGSSVRVRTILEKIELLLHDILLDIGMFHSLVAVRADWGSDLLHRREVSERKVQFARAQNLSSFYGPVTSGPLHYFSLAAACRREEGVDFSAYVDLWKQFAETMLQPSEPTRMPRLTASAGLRTAFKFFGQLSLEVQARIDSLPSGRYRLLYPMRRPAKKAVQTAISAFFKIKHWHRGPCEVVTSEEFNQLVSTSRKFAHWIEVGYIGTFELLIP